MSCGVALLIVIHEYHNVVVVLCVASAVLMRESSSEHNHTYDPCTCMRDHRLHPHSFRFIQRGYHFATFLSRMQTRQMCCKNNAKGIKGTNNKQQQLFNILQTSLCACRLRISASTMQTLAEYPYHSPGAPRQPLHHPGLLSPLEICR